MAGYVNQALQQGETLRITGRLHWIIYLPGVVFLAFAVAGSLALIAAPGANHFYKLIVFAAAFAGVAQFLGALVRQMSTEIAVTDRRVILKTGLVARHTVEMNRDKVESVDVNQDVFGRIFNYGTIVVRGTGAGLEPLSTIAAPLALRDAIAA
ncbi:MAG TPA: PH domain-containing protein [Rhizomicrobium sp.]|jgi:uncharacterized membrane protein YdbT with pleckstrin-like domain